MDIDKHKKIKAAALAVYSSYHVALDESGQVLPEGRNVNDLAVANGHSKEFAAALLEQEGWKLIENAFLDRTKITNGEYFIAIQHKKTGEVIVASPGTENANSWDKIRDWDDLSNAYYGGLTGQFPDFLQFTEHVRNKYGHVDLIAGHSVSSQPAQAVGVLTDIPVITFEPAGQEDLHDSLVAYVGTHPKYQNLSPDDLERRLYKNVTNITFTHPLRDNGNLPQTFSSSRWVRGDQYASRDIMHIFVQRQDTALRSILKGFSQASRKILNGSTELLGYNRQKTPSFFGLIIQENIYWILIQISGNISTTSFQDHYLHQTSLHHVL